MDYKIWNPQPARIFFLTLPFSTFSNWYGPKISEHFHLFVAFFCRRVNFFLFLVCVDKNIFRGVKILFCSQIVFLMVQNLLDFFSIKKRGIFFVLCNESRVHQFIFQKQKHSCNVFFPTTFLFYYFWNTFFCILPIFKLECIYW